MLQDKNQFTKQGVPIFVNKYLARKIKHNMLKIVISGF